MILLSYLAFIVLGVFGTVHGIGLPFLIERFGLSLSLAGLIFTAGSLGYISAASTYSFWETKLRVKHLLTLGGLLSGCSFLVIPLSPSWPVALAFSIIGGFGSGLVEVGFNALIASLEPSQAKSAMNWLHFSFGVGALAGPIALSQVLAISTWHFLYWISGTLFILSAIVWYGSSIRSYHQPSVHSSEPEREQLKLHNKPQFWLLVVAMFIYCGAEVSLAGWITTYLIRDFGLSVELASLGISILWLGLTIGRGICGKLAPYISNKVLLLGLNGASAVFVLVFSLASSGYLALVFLFLAGLSFSAIFPALMLLGTELFPKVPGKVSGGMVTSAGLGSLALPGLLGFFSDTWGLSAGFLLISGLFVLATGSTAFVKVPTALHKPTNKRAEEPVT